MTLPSDYHEAKAYVEIRREQAAAAKARPIPAPKAEPPTPPQRRSLADVYDDARWNALTDRIAERMEAREREEEWDV